MLHHERVTARDAEPERWLLVLHGVFGSGANWRLFTKSVAEARPELGFILVDLRGHGHSPSMEPPHTLAAAAHDVEALAEALALPVTGILGHSLGGKVALCFSALHTGLEQLWVLDSQPGALAEPDSSQTMQVLRMLSGLPKSFPDRQAFVAAVEQAGHSRMIATWLAMSLRRDDGGYRLGLDLEVVRGLLDDHLESDLWPELARDDGPELHVVVGGRSFVWQPGDRERLDELAAKNQRLAVHRLEEAGHWLQVDAPDALRALLVGEL